MSAVTRLATTWTWLYTSPLSQMTRDRRRAEIRNDLAEQSRDGRIDARRVLLGVPADLGWMAGRVVSDRVAVRLVCAFMLASTVGAIWVNHNHRGSSSPDAHVWTFAIALPVLLALAPFRRRRHVERIVSAVAYAAFVMPPLVGAWPLITHPDVAALPWLSVAALAGVVVGGRLPGSLWPGTR
jgi:hypothetical protein